MAVGDDCRDDRGAPALDEHVAPSIVDDAERRHDRPEVKDEETLEPHDRGRSDGNDRYSTERWLYCSPAFPIADRFSSCIMHSNRSYDTVI